MRNTTFEYKAFNARMKKNFSEGKLTHPPQHLGKRLKPVKQTHGQRSRSRPWSADSSSRGKRRSKSPEPRRKKDRPQTAGSRKGRRAGSGYSLLRRKKDSHLGKHSKNKVYVSSSKVAKDKKRGEVSRKDFKQKCVALLRLWEELKIPKRDREFFFGAYCGEVTLSNMERVQSQLKLVLQHRESTIAVLKCIDARETEMKSFAHQLHALQMEEPHDEQTICQSIRRIRKATMGVVQSIVRWRSLLWRPQPFMWKRQNYLLKLSKDLSHLAPGNLEGDMLAGTLGFSIVDTICLVAGEDAHGLAVHRDEISSLEAARKVVVAESTMQQELRMEHERLLMSGYYIPLLRWAPEDKPSPARRGRERDEGCPEIDDGIKCDNSPDDDFDRQVENHISGGKMTDGAKLLFEERRSIRDHAFLVRVHEKAKTVIFSFHENGMASPVCELTFSFDETSDDYPSDVVLRTLAKAGSGMDEDGRMRLLKTVLARVDVQKDITSDAWSAVWKPL